MSVIDLDPRGIEAHECRCSCEVVKDLRKFMEGLPSGIEAPARAAITGLLAAIITLIEAKNDENSGR